MANLVKFILRGIVYSGVIFAFMYYFIYLGGIPNLSERYLNIFNMNAMIITSIICGFGFSAIITFITQRTIDRMKRRR